MSETTLGTANVLIGADDTKLQASLTAIQASLEKQLTMQSAAFEKLGTSMDKTGTKGVTANKKITKSFKESISAALSLERMVGRIAFMAVIGGAMALKNAIQSTFLEGIEDARKFETALAHINTVLDQSAKQYLPAFKSEISGLATDLGEDVVKLSGAMYDIISARISPENAIGVLSESTKLAVGNMAELRDVTSAVLTIMKAYGYEESQVGDITDKLQASIKFGRMELGDMAPVLGDVAAQAAIFGVSLDNVLGSLATMTRAGLSAKKSVTAMRRAYTAIAKDAELSAMVQRDGFLSIIPVIEQMSVKQQQVATGGVRGFNLVATAMRDYENAGEDVKAMLNSTGEAQKAFDLQMATSQKILDKSIQNWKKQWRGIGNTWKDAKSGMTDFGTDTVKMFRSIFEAMRPMQLQLKNIIDQYKEMQGLASDKGKWGDYYKGFGDAYGFKPKTPKNTEDNKTIENIEQEIKLQKERLALANESNVNIIGARTALITLQEKLVALELKRFTDFPKYSEFELSYLKASTALRKTKNEVTEEDLALQKRMDTMWAERAKKARAAKLFAKSTEIPTETIEDTDFEFDLDLMAAKEKFEILGGLFTVTASEMMEGVTDLFLNPFSEGFDMLLGDILNGTNMMKKNFGDYMKAIADSFIMQLGRMIFQALALKAIMAVLGMIGVDATAVSGSVGTGFSKLALTSIPSAPSLPSIGGTGTTPQMSSPTNINNTFAPQNNIQAKFSKRDLGWMYNEGQKYNSRTTV